MVFNFDFANASNIIIGGFIFGSALSTRDTTTIQNNARLLVAVAAPSVLQPPSEPVFVPPALAFAALPAGVLAGFSSGNAA